ncbi:hypothetical protein PPERSA_04291 [Pseudocohnilembus persalinus]|uniref:Uncharacterized protein n=1 Tax=Pseudocohnilembus persalinus TaxID=266149 RepID=A0A0V0QNM9_PSEPJ|nr:hypothetical protein PPERSA_04291 [Pseudocohnilembus persalinus]|eukprot:KRX03783.1 hypothetical protein PPERSA_04291 [Pseudocohnilembus persalinus]
MAKEKLQDHIVNQFQNSIFEFQEFLPRFIQILKNQIIYEIKQQNELVNTSSDYLFYLTTLIQVVNKQPNFSYKGINLDDIAKVFYLMRGELNKRVVDFLFKLYNNFLKQNTQYFSDDQIPDIIQSIWEQMDEDLKRQCLPSILQINKSVIIKKWQIHRNYYSDEEFYDVIIQKVEDCLILMADNNVCLDEKQQALKISLSIFASYFKGLIYNFFQNYHLYPAEIQQEFVHAIARKGFQYFIHIGEEKTIHDFQNQTQQFIKYLEKNLQIENTQNEQKLSQQQIITLNYLIQKMIEAIWKQEEIYNLEYNKQNEVILSQFYTILNNYLNLNIDQNQEILVNLQNFKFDNENIQYFHSNTLQNLQLIVKISEAQKIKNQIIQEIDEEQKQSEENNQEEQNQILNIQKLSLKILFLKNPQFLIEDSYKNMKYIIENYDKNQILQSIQLIENEQNEIPKVVLALLMLFYQDQPEIIDLLESIIEQILINQQRMKNQTIQQWIYVFMKFKPIQAIVQQIQQRCENLQVKQILRGILQQI